MSSIVDLLSQRKEVKTHNLLSCILAFDFLKSHYHAAWAFLYIDNAAPVLIFLAFLHVLLKQSFDRIVIELPRALCYQTASQIFLCLDTESDGLCYNLILIFLIFLILMKLSSVRYYFYYCHFVG